nr:hypothetical protein [Tanacetum cinerariifolium]
RRGGPCRCCRTQAPARCDPVPGWCPQADPSRRRNTWRRLECFAWHPAGLKRPSLARCFGSASSGREHRSWTSRPRCQLLGMAAAFEHQNAFADQVARIGRARLTVAVDDLRRDLKVRVRKTHLLRAIFGADQTGGGQHGATGFIHLIEQVIKVVSG